MTISTKAIIAIAALTGLTIACGPIDNTEAAQEYYGSASVSQDGSFDIEVTALELSAAYEQNEVSAHGAYNGQTAKVTGTVESVTLDFLDNPVVQLEGSGFLTSPHVNGLSHDIAGSITKGEQVTVICQVGNEIMGSVMLDHCSLVPAGS